MEEDDASLNSQRYFIEVLFIESRSMKEDRLGRLDAILSYLTCPLTSQPTPKHPSLQNLMYDTSCHSISSIVDASLYNYAIYIYLHLVSMVWQIDWV
jgi:hypothetical protein